MFFSKNPYLFDSDYDFSHIYKFVHAKNGERTTDPYLFNLTLYSRGQFLLIIPVACVFYTPKYLHAHFSFFQQFLRYIPRYSSEQEKGVFILNSKNEGYS